MCVSADSSSIVKYAYGLSASKAIGKSVAQASPCSQACCSLCMVSLAATSAGVSLTRHAKHLVSCTVTWGAAAGAWTSGIATIGACQSSGVPSMVGSMCSGPCSGQNLGATGCQRGAITWPGCGVDGAGAVGRAGGTSSESFITVSDLCPTPSSNITSLEVTTDLDLWS